MEHGRLEYLLDSIQLFRAQVGELIQQQHHLCRESIGRMVALADLPVSISWDRKGSTLYFQTNEAEEQCRNVGGKENILAGGSVVVGCPQFKSSTKASAKSSRRRRRRNPLVDSQVVNQSGQLHTSSSICTRIADGVELDEYVALQQQRRGNEGLVHSVQGNKRGNEGNISTFFAVWGNEELIPPIERKRSKSNSVSPLHDIVAGDEGELREAEESLPNLEKPRSTSSVSVGGGPSPTKTEVASDLGAPRLTRNRARILQNAGANVTIARGEPPLKKRRGRKGNVNSSDSPAAVEEDETAGNMQTVVAQTALEQQSRDDPPSTKPPAVKKRNTRASSRSPAERNGDVGRNGVTGEAQDVKRVKVENGPPKISRTAEEEKEEDIGEGQLSRTSLGGTRLNSSLQAEANNAFQLDKLKDAKANAHTSVEDHNLREGSAIKRSRERSGNARATLAAAPVEIDGKFKTVGISQNEGVQHTAAADQPVNTLHPLEERNGMESPQPNMITPSSKNGNASELRINCGLAKTSEVDLVDPDRVNALSADRGHVHDCTELPLECLAGAVDPPDSLLKEGTYWGSRRTTLLLSPPLENEFVEREADVIVLDHPEFKDEDSSSISDVLTEEQMEEENRPRPLRADHPRRFSHPLANTDANLGRSMRIVAHSAGEHSLVLELDIIKSRMDAIGAESADLQLPAVLEASEWIEESKDSIPLAEVSISPCDRDDDVVDQGELQSSPGIALELPESVDASEGSILPSQPPQTEITHRSSAGTLVRRERRLTELVTTLELHGEELVDEESDRVRREKRLTLLLTTSEVHGEELLDEEADAVVLCSRLKSTALGHIQGGPNSHTTSDVPHQDIRRGQELRVIIPAGVDLNPSVGQEGRKKTTGILENRQMNVSRVIPSAQNWDRSRILEIGEDMSLVAILSSFGKATTASVNDDHHCADNVPVQRNTDPSCEPSEDGNEVGTITMPLEQASEPPKALERYQMEGIATAPISNAQYSSELRFSRLKEAKSKHATNLEIGKKVKKNLAELKRMQEERKRKLLASRQRKEQLVQKILERRQKVLKQKREQKLAAEQGDKAQWHQAPEEAEREKKAMPQKAKSKQCTPRPTEKENIQRDELKVKGAGQGVLQKGQARPVQTLGKICSNLLGSGTLPLRLAVRVPVVSKEKRTPATEAAAIQKKGRHPSSSSSSSRLLSLNAEPSSFPSLNAESARLPSFNAEPARLSSWTAECAAEGGPQNSTHAFSLDNRPADVQQGGSGDSVSCIETPCSRAVEKEEDLGPMSYEISPYRESSDDEEGEREQPTKTAKHIPFWARKENMNPHLLKQLTLDPDEIFCGWKTCSLKEVFGKTGSQKFQDFGTRSGSGDWFKDRVSWKEELQYKIDMGYVQQKYS